MQNRHVFTSFDIEVGKYNVRLVNSGTIRWVKIGDIKYNKK